MKATSSYAVLLVLLVVACSDAPEAAPPPAPEPAESAAPAGSVPDGPVSRVYFHRGDSLVAVLRPVPEESLEHALRELLRGPLPAEAEQGLVSWFSGATDELIRSVSVDGEGRAIVDFDGISDAIPNASSSAGSALLLEELNATVFRDPAIRSVEYRERGSCEAFWNWLQYDCQVVNRPEV